MTTKAVEVFCEEGVSHAPDILCFADQLLGQSGVKHDAHRNGRACFARKGVSPFELLSVTKTRLPTWSSCELML